jgi:hypothetical protein
MPLNTGTRGGSLHKEGIYQVRILKAEEKVAKSSGNDMVEMQLAVLKNGRPFGSIIYDRVVLTEDTKWRLDQLMDALDAPENQNVPVSWLEGQDLYARIGVDETQDDPRNNVKRYMMVSTAEKLLAREAESNLGDPMAMATENGAKAKQRAPKRNQPSELEQGEDMPL